MSKYYWDKDNLWWQAIAVMFSLTFCFLFIWWALHPHKPPTGIEAARNSYEWSCRNEDGIVNVGSNNHKEWTCIE